MGRLVLPNFFDKYKDHPADLRQSAPSLFSLISATNEPEEADIALDQARSCYIQHKYKDVLNILDRGLRSYFEEAMEHPRQRQLAQHLRLKHLAEILTLWEKSCAWLGVDRTVPATAYLKDIEIIYKALGDSEAVAGLRSTYAYRYVKLGNLENAMSEIDRGLGMARKLSTIRFLKEAKASLARKVEYFPEAIKLYGEVRRLDDKLDEISQASRSLPMAWMGILQGLEWGRSRYEGVNMALEALDLCAETGHIGFQAQILSGLVNCLIEITDYDSAREMLNDLTHLLSRFPESFPDLTARAERLALLLSIESRGWFEGLVSSSEWASLHDIVSAITWRPLRGVLQACLREVLKGEPYASRVLLCSAAEYVTEALFEKHGLGVKLEEGNRSLFKKNIELYKAGVYSGDAFVRMERLAQARNKIFHAMPGDIEARQMGRSVAIIEAVLWLTRLIQENHLIRFIPKGSKKERKWENFLSGRGDSND